MAQESGLNGRVVKRKAKTGRSRPALASTKAASKLRKPARKRQQDPLAGLRAIEAEKRRVARIRKRQRELKQLVNAARVRKGLRGHIAPLAVAGKLKGKFVTTKYRGKVLLVQVSKTGKKHLFREVRGQKEFRPKHVGSFSIGRKRGSKKLLSKFYVNLISTRTAKARMIPTAGERLARSGVSFDRVVKEIANDLIARSRAKSGKQFVIELTVKVKGLKPFTALADFKIGMFQKLTRSNVRAFVLGVLWAQIAQWLTRHEMVSLGSAAYIENLLVNWGKRPSRWKTATGEKWGKGSYDRVRFDFVMWDIKRIAIGKEKAR